MFVDIICSELHVPAAIAGGVHGAEEEGDGNTRHDHKLLPLPACCSVSLLSNGFTHVVIQPHCPTLSAASILLDVAACSASYPPLPSVASTKLACYHDYHPLEESAEEAEAQGGKGRADDFPGPTVTCQHA